MAGLAAAVLTPTLGACGITPGGRGTSTRQGPTCVPAADTRTYARLGTAGLQYEVNDRPITVRMEPGFAARLTAWFTDWCDLTGTAPDLVGTYGAWLPDDGSCDSWHHAGRAFDISRLATGGTELVSCRYDRWGGTPTADRLSAYWALAASLHLHFAYVLTHLFDDAHANHIHVDNGVSGGGMSTFTGRSRVQHQAVQAICRQLWGRDLPITGVWDTATRQAVNGLLGQLGLAGPLTRQESWQGFLRASVRRWAEAR